LIRLGGVNCEERNYAVGHMMKIWGRDLNWDGVFRKQIQNENQERVN